MLVRYWMKKSPITVEEGATLLDALKIFHTHHIRRLPVLKESKVIGMLSLSDLYRFLPPRALEPGAGLDATERHTLSEQKVRDNMIKEPFSCQLNTPLEDVGALMRREKVGCLPVLTEDGKLVGIITESDVLEALLNVTAAGQKGRRICFSIEPNSERKMLTHMIELTKELKLKLHCILTHELHVEPATLVMLRVSGRKEGEDAFIDTIWKDYKRVLTVD